MFSVQLLSLVKEILLRQVLDVEQALDNLIHGAVNERQGQVAQSGVGQALLEGAGKQSRRAESYEEYDIRPGEQVY